MVLKMEKSDNSNKVKKYYIEIFYETGDSFSSSDEICTLELQWDNLDIAKENIKRIQAHNEWYEDNHGYRIYRNASPSFNDGDLVKELTDNEIDTYQDQNLVNGDKYSTLETTLSLA